MGSAMRLLFNSFQGRVPERDRIMGILRVCCVLACSAICLWSTSTAQTPDARAFKVEGLVVEAGTGKPLPQAQVEILTYFYQRQVLTGPDGAFSFDAVPGGDAYLTPSKPGYLVPGKTILQTLGHLGLSRRIDIGPNTGKVVLELKPGGAVISGRVIGADRKPLQGAIIHAQREIIINGWRTEMPGVLTGTDRDGNFVGTLPPGRYYLSVTTDRIPADHAAGKAYPKLVYYPSVTDPSEAVPVDLAAGQTVDAQFALSMVPAYTVTGKVLAPKTWYRCPEMYDSLRRYELFFNEGQVATFCDYDNSDDFEYSSLPAGTYVLLLHSQSMETFAQTITVNTNITDLKLSPKSFPGIDVVVHTEFTRTPATPPCTPEQQRIRVQECLGPAVSLVSAVDGQGGLPAGAGPELNSVAPGKYLVQAWLSRSAYVHGAYVQSMRSGSLDLFREALIVPEGGAVAPIEIVMRDDSARLKLTINGKAPAQEAHIMVFRKGTRLSLYPPDAGDRKTEILLPPLAPGEYRVFAFDSMDGLEYNNPAVLAKYASKATTVSLSANENRSLAVNLIHNDTAVSSEAQ
jgi:hypothetical protein